jgi:hypothetical protein
MFWSSSSISSKIRSSDKTKNYEISPLENLSRTSLKKMAREMRNKNKNMLPASDKKRNDVMSSQRTKLSNTSKKSEKKLSANEKRRGEISQGAKVSNVSLKDVTLEMRKNKNENKISARFSSLCIPNEDQHKVNARSKMDLCRRRCRNSIQKINLVQEKTPKNH